MIMIRGGIPYTHIIGDTIMKKHFLLLACATIMLIFANASACPYEFSPEDARPFFEQYENEIVPPQQTTVEKEIPS